MPSRLRKEEEPTVLTPQLAEAVARQTERRRAEAEERERLEKARVEELAGRLEISPEEVRRMAREEARRLAAPARHPFRLSRGALHAAYLAALAVVGAWGYRNRQMVTLVAEPAPPVLGAPPATTVSETFPMDPSLVSPPKGLKVSVRGDRAQHSVIGLQGPTPRTPAAAKALKASIKALLKWEEAGYGSLLRFKEPGYTSPATGRFKPAPAPGGWHCVTVTGGATTVVANIPDAEYAEYFKDFERERDAALDAMVDGKLWPELAKEIPVPQLPTVHSAPSAPKPKTPLDRIRGLRGGP